MDSEQLNEARRHVRRFRRGVLRIDGEVAPCAFVIDGADGRFVLPSDEDLTHASDIVLYVPDDGFNEMALLINPAGQVGSFDEARDRYLAYHGRAEAIEWFRCDLDSAKWGGEIYEGADLLGPNTLRAIEPGLCKMLNADRDVLARVSELLTRVHPENPLCVGVDQLGMDVRTRVGIIRVEWPAEITEPESAPGIIRALLKGAA